MEKVKLSYNNGFFYIIVDGNDFYKVPLDKGLYLVNKDNQSEYYRKFRNCCEFLKLNETNIIQKFRKIYKDSLPPHEEEDYKEEEVVVDRSIETWDEMKKILNKDLPNRERETEILSSVVLGQLYGTTESLFLIMMSDAGSGKSTLCDLFRGSELCHITEQMTRNAFAPGAAKVGDTPFSVLNECKEKTLIIHDLTSIFKDKEDKVKKFIGDLEASYGNRGLTKSSPGLGTITYGGRFNIIFGTTSHVFWKNKNVATDMLYSQRYLIVKLSQRDEYEDFRKGYLINDLTDLRRKMCGFLLNRMDCFVNPIVSQEIRNYMIKILKPVLDKWGKSSKTRRFKQCIQFCKGLMLLHGKLDIEEYMVDRFLELITLEFGKTQKKQYKIGV